MVNENGDVVIASGAGIDLYRAGQRIHLLDPAEDGLPPKVYDINNWGDIVGTNTTGVPSGIFYDGKQLRWRNLVDEIFPGSEMSSFRAINERRQITGQIETDETHQAFIYDVDSGNVTLIPLLTGMWMQAAGEAINEAGTIVGTSIYFNGSTFKYTGFQWSQNDGLKELQFLSPKSISNSGRVYGVT